MRACERAGSSSTSPRPRDARAAGACASGADPSATRADPSAGARSALAPEPAPDAAGATTVALRLFGARREQRRFLRTALVEQLFAFVASASEEAAGGRAFEVRSAFPRKCPSGLRGQTLEEAGVCDSALTVAWI